MKKSNFGKQLVALLIIVTVSVILAACSSTTATTPAASPSRTPGTTTSTTTPATSPSPSSSSSPGPAITLNLVAEGMAFDQSTLTVSAGANVTLNFNNKDGGIPHNFALYTDSSASTPIFVGQTITGPATITYTFAAPANPGIYFFRCDIHPAQMTGSFVVTAAGTNP